MTTDTMIKKRWTYIGRRVSTNHTVLYVFVDEAGEERIFGKAPRYPVIGAIYEVEATDDNTSAFITSAERTEDRVQDEGQIAAWKLADDEAYTEVQSARTSKKLRADTNIGALTLDEVREMLDRGPVPRRRAVLAVVFDYLL